MKISIEESIGSTRKVEILTEAITIDEVLEEIKNLLLAYGFHIHTIRDGFYEMSEDLERNYPDNEKETNENS